MSTDQSTRVRQARESILRSARREIERNGILGLRVADVAEGANCSVTQIYRYFTNRDGLLAQVLGDIYEELLAQSGGTYREAIFSHDVITVDIILDALPRLFDGPAVPNQNVRLQILAASVTNTPLRERLEQISRKVAHEWEDGLDEIERRLAPRENFDRRVFTMMLANFLPYYRILLGEGGFTQEEFTHFLRDKFSN